MSRGRSTTVDGSEPLPEVPGPTRAPEVSRLLEVSGGTIEQWLRTYRGRGSGRSPA